MKLFCLKKFTISLFGMSILSSFSYANDWHNSQYDSQTNKQLLSLEEIKAHINESSIRNNFTFNIGNTFYYYDCRGNYYIWTNNYWEKIPNTIGNPFANQTDLEKHVRKNNIYIGATFCFNGNWYYYGINGFQYSDKGRWFILEKTQNSNSKYKRIISNNEAESKLINVKNHVTQYSIQSYTSFRMNGECYYHDGNGNFYISKNGQWVKLDLSSQTQEREYGNNYGSDNAKDMKSNTHNLNNEAENKLTNVKNHVTQYSIQSYTSFSMNGECYYHDGNGNYYISNNGQWVKFGTSTQVQDRDYGNNYGNDNFKEMESFTHMENAVKPYIIKIKQNLMRLGVSKSEIDKVNNIPIRFASLSSQNAAGMCYFGYTNRIEIDYSWHNLGDNEKMTLLAHELGHCAWQIDHVHDSSKIMNTSLSYRINEYSWQNFAAKIKNKSNMYALTNNNWYGYSIE